MPLTAALALLSAVGLVQAAFAAGATTPTKTHGNGGNPNQQWTYYGDLVYTSTFTSGNTYFYDWGNSLTIAIGPSTNYVDHEVFYRAVLVYDPNGSPSTIWQSRAQNDMHSEVLDGGGAFARLFSEAPDTEEASPGNLIGYKVQTAVGNGTQIDASSVTLTQGAS